MSPTSTQYGPGVREPVNCGAVPAGVCVEPPESSAHAVLLGVPTPRPMVIVGGGPAALSVTFTVPLCATVNDLKSLPPTGTVPVKVSVVIGTDGDVVLELSEPLLSHATAINMSANATGIKRLMRSFLGSPRQAGRRHWHLWLSEKAYQKLTALW